MPTPTPNIVQVCHICDRPMMPEVQALVYLMILLTILLACANVLAVMVWGTLKTAKLIRKHW